MGRKDRKREVRGGEKARAGANRVGVKVGKSLKMEGGRGGGGWFHGQAGVTNGVSGDTPLSPASSAGSRPGCNSVSVM